LRGAGIGRSWQSADWPTVSTSYSEEEQENKNLKLALSHKRDIHIYFSAPFFAEKEDFWVEPLARLPKKKSSQSSVWAHAFSK